MFFPGLGLVKIIMVSDYRRGWEDALDVVLDLDDLNEIEKIRNRLRRERITHLHQGPYLEILQIPNL